MAEQVKEQFKQAVINLTSIAVIIIVALMIATLHIFKFFRRILHKGIFTTKEG